MTIKEIPRLIAELYRVTEELNRLFHPRPFTPDGHLVGSIGEVVAAYVYEINLEPCSTQSFDGRLKDNRIVEIKLTAGASVNISASDQYADCLIALKLVRDFGFNEIYAGRFPEHLVRQKRMNKRGFTTITTTALRACNPSDIPNHGRLAELNALFAEVIR